MYGHCLQSDRQQRSGELTGRLMIIGPHARRFVRQSQWDCVNPLFFVGGDMNYLGLDDPEADWPRLQPHNRLARCLPRTSPDAPWIGDRAVGRVFRDGEMTDVAAHLADLHQDPGYRTPTCGGGIRLDQFHVTPALRPAIVDYRLVDTGDDSDHDGALVTLDLDLVDLTATLAYA